MASHALDTGHRVDLQNIEILKCGLRLIAEAVEITKHPCVNRIEGAELRAVWRAVLGQRN